MNMTVYEKLQIELLNAPKTWLVTGVAGFIGSNLLEKLLKLDQRVVGLDNFATGYQKNLDAVQSLVTDEQWKRFRFIKGDIRKIEDCNEACSEVDYVLHQAALGSVPRSLEDPIATNSTNVTGFLNMLVASRDARVKSFTYAASSSTYGDHPDLPKVEDKIGRPLSPYAVTKLVNEVYADVFARCFGFNSIGLRYFNVFGPRQDPKGAYAAVIPLWIDSILNGENVYINGDGSTTRDFTYVTNVIQANILAATTSNVSNQKILNIASGESSITLNELYEHIMQTLKEINKEIINNIPIYRNFRSGDIKHSRASILKAMQVIKFIPDTSLSEGIKRTIDWFIKNK